jgi:hypothetical protein
MRDCLQPRVLHTTVPGMWPVPVRCANGLVAALLRPRGNKLLDAALHAAGRRVHGPR